MKITKYTVEQNGDKIPALFKESETEYGRFEKLDIPEKAAALANDIYRLNKKAEEHIVLISLDTKLRPVGIFELSHGTRSSALITAREVYIRAILSGAASFILLHNHPSGDLSPSAEDVKLTKSIMSSAAVMGIAFHDHLIVGGHELAYYSFREKDHEHGIWNASCS